MAVALSAGGGPMAGIGVSGGFVSSYYPDYNEIDDIGGLFINGGGSVVIGGGLGCDIICNPDTNEDVGYADSLLAGLKIKAIDTLPMESHIFPTYTWILYRK